MRLVSGSSIPLLALLSLAASGSASAQTPPPCAPAGMRLECYYNAAR